jgi:putative ABC transport system substrate-binding protein
VRRREFITLLGGAAAAWPLAARAQQQVVPVVGYLSSVSPEADARNLTAFRQGLAETGYVEGRNVAIEYRGMQGHYDLLPALLADFVHRPVAVIVVTGNTPAVLAAKAATSTIPIVFTIGVDPVEAGIVPNFNRPGGNITGISNLAGQLAAKRLELLHELVPNASVIAVLVNESNSPFTEYEMQGVRVAAQSHGVQLHLLNGGTSSEIDSAFATLPQVRPGALLISGEFFFVSRRAQLVALAARYTVPTIYFSKPFAAAGGLISYGPAQGAGGQRVLGVYVGRILKGEKPGDLPVQQPTRVELIINLKTAKALGITFPLTLLGRADDVIE